MTMPYACDPSSLPQYPPSKEMDAKRRDEEARRFVTSEFLVYWILVLHHFDSCFLSSALSSKIILRRYHLNDPENLVTKSTKSMINILR